MPYGGKDWLALTKEDTLEPALPICDPHHHFWDFRTERIPNHRYLLHELVADINSGHNICSTVFVEARSMYKLDGANELRSVGEVEFAQGLAAASASGMYGSARVAQAIIGHADLTLGNRVEPVLEALEAASPNRFRGIRHSVTWDAHPDILKLTAYKLKSLLANGFYRSGAKVLAKKGLSLEAWLYAPQLLELVDFAKAVPDLTIILNHIGGLIRVGPYANREDEVLESWQNGIATVAKCPNVFMKLGGMGMPHAGFNWHTRAKPIGSEELAKSMAPYIQYCVEQFGPYRCMFESNFPVDKVSYSYNVLFNAFKRLSQGYSDTERDALFSGTAKQIYRLD